MLPAALLTAVLLPTAVEAPEIDTVVVCPPTFRQALTPWIQHRTKQGHRVAVVGNEGTNEDIRNRILNQNGGKVRFVVLIGDSEPAAEHRARSVPTYRVEAKVNVRWGSEPEIGTDNSYGDFDGDNVPDVAVGRLPADTPQELASMVAQIIEYETNTDFGPWRQRINFVAGVGGFGALADSMLETVTKKFLTDSIPPEYTTHMTYASWRSPYCPDPRLFRSHTIERLNEGSLVWVYIGHGNKRHLDYVKVPGAAAPILHADDCSRLESRHGGPIAVFLSCYAGAYDQQEDCLAEEMLRRPRGPIAIICGSRMTMPYAMSVMSHQMLHDVFRERKATLGEVFLSAKQKMIEPPNENATRMLLDGMAKLISPAPADLDGERREHLSLMNLLGDPLLRIRLPETFPVAGPEDIEAGQLLRVQLKPEFIGRATVQLACRRDGQTEQLRKRGKFERTQEFLVEMDKVYDKANDHAWATKKIAIAEAKPFNIEFTVPTSAKGPHFVKVFLEGKNRYAAVAHEVYVRESQPEDSPTKNLPASVALPSTDLPE